MADSAAAEAAAATAAAAVEEVVPEREERAACRAALLMLLTVDRRFVLASVVVLEVVDGLEEAVVRLAVAGEDAAEEVVRVVVVAVLEETELNVLEGLRAVGVVGLVWALLLGEAAGLLLLRMVEVRRVALECEMDCRLAFSSSDRDGCERCVVDDAAVLGRLAAAVVEVPVPGRVAAVLLAVDGVLVAAVLLARAPLTLRVVPTVDLGFAGLPAAFFVAAAVVVSLFPGELFSDFPGEDTDAGGFSDVGDCTGVADAAPSEAASWEATDAAVASAVCSDAASDAVSGACSMSCSCSCSCSCSWSSVAATELVSATDSAGSEGSVPGSVGAGKGEVASAAGAWAASSFSGSDDDIMCGCSGW